MTPGKNAPGLRGFPTPNDVPDAAGYIVFRFPNDNDWAGLLLGAAQALTKAYNFYQWGDLTPEEAAIAFIDIVAQAPLNSCGCTLPGGSRLIRIGVGGHFEELGDDGEWQGPTGDYAVPAVPERSGGTPQDQICLAAANAANCLEQLYEQLSDDWADGVSTAEAATNFLLAIAAIIAAPFGLLGEAIVAIAALVFQVLYETIAFVGADLWDETFTATLVCILVGCATNDEGVITFDLDCVNNQLAAHTNPFTLTADQIRLFGQLQYIFQFIGVDGLNSAGATTAITEADCSDCVEPCNEDYDFTLSDGGWCDFDGSTGLFCTGQRGEYVFGVGWQGVQQGDFALLYLAKLCAAGVTSQVTFDLTTPYTVTLEIRILRASDLEVVDTLLSPGDVSAGTYHIESTTGSTYGYPVYILISVEATGEQVSFPLITAATIHS